jgi:hypothetical protein
VDEELAWQQVDDLIGRDPAVGAANPQVLRGLLRRKPGEETGPLSRDVLDPAAILLEEM